jgi:hypothetical protein
MARAQALAPNAALLWLGAKATTIVGLNALGELGAVSIPIGAMRLNDAAGVSNLSSRLRATLKTPPASLRLDGETAALPTLLSIARQLLPNCEITSAASDERPLAVRVASAAAERVAAHHRATWNFAPRRPLLSPELVKSGLLRSLGAPLAIFCLFLIVATVSDTRAIRAEAESQRAEISEIFKRNFPRSRDGGDPLRMMTNIVDRAGKKRPAGSAGKVIEGMAAFHDSITNASGINVAELRTADGNWTMRGEAPDFGGVERIKSALESVEKFSDVRVQRAEQTPDKSAIRFSLTWEEKR